ncbi:amylovoran biosynthesis protein AmsD [Dulcicalothrix desertica PCC 7102]|uniref:Amylovoran biosynthesis protein AmsD n=1 Tax=Dulcicalothrix desertica PCC 7102 TaxID=232991 RepID=A0A433VAR9_9CYAN|nr:glycosyltransferase family 4 protein [Dulcicalothrix desertica]RUT03109.1 amylovoran biosynthesis protein AmsD [Dulcicalothrix desertica PCC 7102]TWH53484.1 glycosyltransferase involved in cell wall biosynthesis [Dulcicalothrix desertica PCC 7102]
MNITLVVSALYSGGAERVVVLIAKGLIDRGHKVTVITLYGRETDFYSLPEGVIRVALGIMSDSINIFQALYNNLHRLIKLRQAIISTKPDIVLSHLTSTNILTIVSLFHSKLPVFVTEHSDPKMFSYGRIWELLRRLSYPYADRVVSVSKGVDCAFDWLAKSKRAVIYNPFILPNKQDNKEIINFLNRDVDPGKKWVVAMGRLLPQKGFDILLSAFAKIAHLHPDWQLLILGKGELYDELEEMKENLGLSGKVVFVGVINNPFAILKRAKLFVMSSRHEAFPMALGEAMACGLPVISTDCHSGPREIIRDGIDGILVPSEDVLSLAKTMDHLMSDETIRQRLSTYAPEVTERFSIEKILSEWENLFKLVLLEKYKYNLKDIIS